MGIWEKVCLLGDLVNGIICHNILENANVWKYYNMGDWKENKYAVSP